jgi:hypothetical protein
MTQRHKYHFYCGSHLLFTWYPARLVTASLADGPLVLLWDCQWTLSGSPLLQLQSPFPILFLAFCFSSLLWAANALCTWPLLSGMGLSHSFLLLVSTSSVSWGEHPSHVIIDKRWGPVRGCVSPYLVILSTTVYARQAPRIFRMNCRLQILLAILDTDNKGMWLASHNQAQLLFPVLVLDYFSVRFVYSHTHRQTGERNSPMLRQSLWWQHLVLKVWLLQAMYKWINTNVYHSKRDCPQKHFVVSDIILKSISDIIYLFVSY